MAKAMKSAQQVAQNWASAMAAAGPKITQGVQSVTTAPGQAAAAQQSAYLQGVQQSAAKWATNVGSVSLQSWQQSMTSKGVPRVAQGAQAAQGKMQTAMQQLLPAIQSAVAALPPRGAKGSNQQRMLQFSQAMSGYKQS